MRFWYPITTFLLLVSLIRLPALSFEEILSSRDTLPDLEAARLDYLLAEKEAEAAAFTGSPLISLTPQITMKNPETGSFNPGGAAGTTLSASIPLGLSREEKVRAFAGEEELLLARGAYQRFEGETILGLLQSFIKAWLAQEEEGLLALELKAAEEEARVQRELFERGQSSLKELNEAEDLWGEAQRALIEGTLNRRISWLELAFQVGLDFQTTPELEPLVLATPTMPRPSELSSWAQEHSPELQELNSRIARLAYEETLEKSFSLSAVRLSFSGWDQSASISYSPENPALGLNYTSPSVTFGEDFSSSSSSAAPVWQLGLSVTLAWEGPGRRKIDSKLRSLELNRIQDQLRLQQEQLFLIIRSRNQQYQLSKTGVEQALALLEQVDGAYQLVMEQRASQRATLAEELAAETQLRRARFRYETARLQELETAFTLARDAYWLDQLIEQAGL